MFDLFGKLFFGITNAFWWLFIALPLKILDVVQLAIEIIGTKLNYLILFGTSDSFSFDNLPSLFFNFLIMSVLLFVILFMANIIRAGLQGSEQGTKKMKQMLKFSVLGWFTIFMVPVGIFTLYLTIDIFLSLVTKDDGGLSQAIINLLKPESISKELWEPVSKNYELTYEIYKDAPDGSIITALFFGLFICVGVIYAYFLAGITILQKTLDQIFLFIISPFVATTMILDGGARIGQWRQQFIAKSLTAFAIIIGSKIFISVVQTVLNNIDSFLGDNNNLFLKYIVIGITIVGGALALVEFGNIIAGFVGEGVGLKESAANTRSLIKASGAMMAIGGSAGFVAKKTLLGTKIGVGRTAGLASGIVAGAASGALAGKTTTHTLGWKNKLGVTKKQGFVRSFAGKRKGGLFTRGFNAFTGSKLNNQDLNAKIGASRDGSRRQKSLIKTRNKRLDADQFMKTKETQQADFAKKGKDIGVIDKPGQNSLAKKTNNKK